MELLTPFEGITDIGGRRFVWGERTYVMGVINVTPDSFSHDGVGGDVEVAVRLAAQFQEDGGRHHRRGRGVDTSSRDIRQLEAGDGQRRA